MNKRITAKRVTAFMFAAVMAVAFMPVLGGGTADAATPKGRLPQQVTCQFKNAKGKWETSQVITFKYNSKKDPTAIKYRYYDNGKIVETEKLTNQFAYKNGKRSVCTSKWDYYSNKESHKWTYDKNGNPQKYAYRRTHDGLKDTIDTKLTYTKTGYLKTDTTTTVFGSDTDNTEYDYWKYVTATKNGLPTNLTGYRKEEGKWEKFYAQKFNKMGLLTISKRTSGTNYPTYSYKMKNGRVAYAVVTYHGDPVIKEKYIFKYTNKTAKKKRYAKMINSITYGGTPFAWF